jgi:hypothetical protein
MKPQTIGLIVNPRSGLGAAHNLRIAQELVAALDVRSVLTGPGTLGADALPAATVLAIPDVRGRAASQAVAQQALRAGVDALAVIGGDGTLSDVAFTILQSGIDCPVLGIGAGSVNAGKLITRKAAQIAQLRGSDFRVDRVHALQASYNDQALALAFNDVVIGTTIVGTVDGAWRDLDANAFMTGRQQPGKPRPIGTDAARVVKRGAKRDLLVASGHSVGTVIAGFAQDDSFFGKAIIGAVGISSLAGAPAGCLVCEQPLVSVSLDLDEHLQTEPIRSAYVSLLHGDTIEISGLTYPAVLCADGNPLAALQADDRSQIRVLPEAVAVLRIA